MWFRQPARDPAPLVLKVLDPAFRDEATFLQRFVGMVNADGAHYDFVVGPRLGHSVSKEQYAFIYDKARIEVGYGLEGVISDAVAGRILREDMLPLFKQSRYGDGLIAAAQRVATLAGGGQIPAPAKTQSPSRVNPLVLGSVLSIFTFLGGLVLGSGLRAFSPVAILFGLIFG